MENTEKSALELAEKEIAETGALSFPGRRRLWEAMGPLEPREQDSGTPRSLTGPLKKRAELALACAKESWGFGRDTKFYELAGIYGFHYGNPGNSGFFHFGGHDGNPDRKSVV